MGIPSLLMTVFCLLYEKMLNAGMGNKFEFDKEIIMIPISDILIRSISGYVFMVPVFVLYFLWLKKLGRTQSFLHTAAVFVFGSINEQIQNIAQKKDTLCRRMYN